MPKPITQCFILFLILLPLSISAAFSQDLWQPVKSKNITTKGLRLLIPHQYKTYRLNKAKAQQLLNSLKKKPQNLGIIYLPTPKGRLAAFKIWRTPILPKPLQKKYPGIKTFTAVSMDNPFISAKIDYTLKGFHAMVFRPGQVWMIDPYSNINDGYYITFFQTDAPQSSEYKMICQNSANGQDGFHPNGEAIQLKSKKGRGKLAKRTFGSTQRTYRLALSCTGEYAQAVDGNSPSKAGVLSAMTTSINRVNGIYEREIEVHLQFIPNEDTLIYLNPNTDPFTANFNGFQLLGQNQTNTDHVIGAAGYDIGHIFSTGGGGIARLGGVCNNHIKARGVTGMRHPVGDAFNVDYVAHEMGHQFGANHSFNSCSNGNNANQATAYEPGSGSTIMCYAGICGAENNLQLHSDDYFHAVSLMEISNFLNGGGNTCAVESNNPTAIPGFPSIQKTYIIPAATPFELEAPQANAGNSNPLSYSWEQWDLGDFRVVETQGDTFHYGPNLRSVYPKPNNRKRVFPNIDAVVQNQTEIIGERLSKVNRHLHFKLTVRNINNGWGSFKISEDSLTVQVINTGQPFKVTSQNNSNLTFDANSTLPISWDIAGTNTAPINCERVDVYFSKDSGYTYPYKIADNIPNTGHAIVTLPNVNTHGGRIKVKGHHNIFFDLNDYNFTTKNATGINTIATNQTIKVFPNPAMNKIVLESTSPNQMQAQLINEIGQVLWKDEFRGKTNLSTCPFAPGLYLIRLTNKKTKAHFTKKIILK